MSFETPFVESLSFVLINLLLLIPLQIITGTRG